MGLSDILANPESVTSGRKTVALNGTFKPMFGGGLSADINRHLLNIADKSDHRTAGFHASGVYSICDRQYILQKMTGKALYEYIEPGLRLKFIYGSNLHRMIQDDLLGPTGILLGMWKCSSCGYFDNKINNVERNYITYPGPCQCGDTRWHYVEPKMEIAIPGITYSEEWRIVGATDGLTTREEVIDIKTIKGDKIDGLEKAWESIFDVDDFGVYDDTPSWDIKSARKYYVQIQLYMYGFNKQKGIIYYIPKTTADDLNTWVQILVERNDKVVKDIFRKIKNLHKLSTECEDVSKKIKLPAKVCKTQYSYTARDCGLCKECFAV